MRFLLGLLISFQIMAAPMANQLGQNQEETASSIMLNALSEAEAKSFTETVRNGIDDYHTKGLDHFLNTNFTDLTPEDSQALIQLQKLTKNFSSKFKEDKPGQWSMQDKGYKATFSVLSIHQGYILINNEKFQFSDLTLSQLKSKLDRWEPARKTTFLKRFNNSFGIAEAEAFLFVAVILVAVVAMIGTALWKLKLQPERSVKKINDIRDRLDKKKASCESAPNNVSGFREIADLVKPVKSYDDKFEAALKEMIQSSAVNSESCYDAIHQAGKAIKINVPKLSEGQQSKLEQNSGNKKALAASDVTGALYDMCRSFSGFQNCLSNFTSNNVNNMQYKMLDDDTKERLNQIRPSANQQ